MRHRHAGEKRRAEPRRESRRSSRLPVPPRDSFLPLAELGKALGNRAFSRFIQTSLPGRKELADGHPLDPATRARMEGSFGQDFSGVVIHSDADAAAAARALNARAFALGNHIVFDSGEYVPGSVLGDILIAHELAHVQQQAAGYAGADSAVDDRRLETHANVAAVRATTSMAGGAKAAFAGIAREAIPTLKSSLRPQRCPQAQKMSAPSVLRYAVAGDVDSLERDRRSGCCLVELGRIRSDSRVVRGSPRGPPHGRSRRSPESRANDHQSQPEAGGPVPAPGRCDGPLPQ